MAKGYYSLIQYCPDASRAESANVGVLLSCPEMEFINVIIARRNDRVSRFFGRDSFSNNQLNAAKNAFKNRIDNFKTRFVELSDLNKFIETRANEITLTTARPVKVDNPEEKLNELFDELVGGRRIAAKKEREPDLFNELDVALKERDIKRRIKSHYTIQIRGFNYGVFADYSYRNGLLTVIKKHSFTSGRKKSLTDAKSFAVDGDLLARYGSETEGKGNLVVVGAFSNGARPAIEETVRPVFEEYKIRLITPNAIRRYLDEIRREAEPLPFTDTW